MTCTTRDHCPGALGWVLEKPPHTRRGTQKGTHRTLGSVTPCRWSPSPFFAETPPPKYFWVLDKLP